MSGFTILHDPVALTALSAAGGAVLLIGALAKLADLDAFSQAVGDFRLLPQSLVRPFSLGFPLLEAFAGLALCGAAAWPQPYGAALAAATVATASAGVVVNLLRGRTGIDCGCGGPGHPISWGLVLRNISLIGAIALSTLAPVARSINALDFVSGAAAFLFLLSTYFASSQLLGNHQHLKGAAIWFRRPSR